MIGLQQTTPPKDVPSATSAHLRDRRAALLRSLGGWVLILSVLILAVQWGLDYRRWAYERTAPIRFVADISRGYYWGQQAAREGYLDLYDRMSDQQPGDRLWLDYAPLRLGVMSLWGHWAREHFPDQHRWREGYDLNWPILAFNSTMGVIGAAGIFLLICVWRRRMPHPVFRQRSRWRRGWVRFVQRRDPLPLEAPEAPRPPASSLHGALPAVAGALFFWFNPAMVLSSHGWPTWDMWIVPFYVWAVLAAVLERWFIAGVLIAIGAMFKGQQFFVAPLFIAWPLLQGRPGAAMRWVLGLVFALGVLALPWLVSDLSPGGLDLPRRVDYSAIAWVLSCVLAAPVVWVTWRWPRDRVGLPPETFRRVWLTRLAIRSAVTLSCAVLILWPWLRSGYRHGLPLGVVLTALLLGSAVLLKKRHQPYLWAGTLGAALLLCMMLFRESSAWVDCSFGYGTRHWPRMILGRTSNLAGVLSLRFGWEAQDTLLTFGPGVLLGWPGEPIEVSVRAFLLGLFVLFMGACLVGVARQHRRGDPRFLLAVTAPWVVFFAFSPQMHERYLLFAAGVGALAAGVSLGSTLLVGFLSLVSYVMMSNEMLAHGRWRQFGADLSSEFPRQFRRIIATTHPDIGWAVVLAALIFVYWSLTRSCWSLARPSRAPCPTLERRGVFIAPSG